MPYRPCILFGYDLTEFPDVAAALREFADAEIGDVTREALWERVAEAEGLVTPLMVTVDAALLERATRLRVIATPSTGTDHIDLAAAERRGIPVISLRGEREFLRELSATAEHAFGLLLALVRFTPAAHASILRGEWERERYRGIQLRGRTLGVVGYGRLGSLMAGYGRAFGMRVIAAADHRTLPPEEVQQVPLATLMEQADVISVHVSLTELTRHLISTEQLARVKPGAVLINTARGEVIDEAALLEALETGRLAGAALDVMSHERDPEYRRTHPLIEYAREHENLILTPHIGGATYDTQARTFRFVVDKLRKFFTSSSRV